MTASIFEIAARCWPSARGIPSFPLPTFPMSTVNDALEHLRAGEARYGIVLVNESVLSDLGRVHDLA
jgi:hypothetical protein